MTISVDCIIHYFNIKLLKIKLLIFCWTDSFFFCFVSCRDLSSSRASSTNTLKFHRYHLRFFYLYVTGRLTCQSLQFFQHLLFLSLMTVPMAIFRHIKVHIVIMNTTHLQIQMFQIYCEKPLKCGFLVNQNHPTTYFIAEKYPKPRTTHLTMFLLLTTSLIHQYTTRSHPTYLSCYFLNSIVESWLGLFHWTWVMCDCLFVFNSLCYVLMQIKINFMGQLSYLDLIIYCSSGHQKSHPHGWLHLAYQKINQ